MVSVTKAMIRICWPQRGTLGQRGEALAAEHDMGVGETRTGEAEVVEAVVEHLAHHGDAERVHAGEVGQAEMAGRVV